MRFVCACVCVCVLRISRNNTKTIQQQIKTCWAWKVLKTHPPPCSRPTCLTYYQPWLRAAGHKVKCPIQDFSTHMSVLMKNKVGEGKQKGNTPGGGCKNAPSVSFCRWYLPSASTEASEIKPKSHGEIIIVLRWQTVALHRKSSFLPWLN